MYGQSGRQSTYVSSFALSLKLSEEKGLCDSGEMPLMLLEKLALATFPRLGLSNPSELHPLTLSNLSLSFQVKGMKRNKSLNNNLKQKSA